MMMGNAAIVLPSSDNPLTLMKLTEMLVEAGVPNGVIVSSFCGSPTLSCLIEMPFGGWKHSGIGTEGVLSTFNEMTRVKTIVLKNVL